MRKRVCLTGGGGFVGAHTLAHLLQGTDWDVVVVDSFRHKGKTDRISQTLRGGPPAWRDRVQIYVHDLTAPVSAQGIAAIGPLDYIIAMASGSHVDRSIADPVPFVRNNVELIMSTLELARQAQPGHMIVISTDEVYGPVRADQPPHGEWAPILPSNPYSASKACQEALAVSWWRTYGVPLSIVNAMNIYGEMQDREKYLPSLISKISAGETVTVHGTAGNIGTRHWLHARNLSDALLFIFANLPPASFGSSTRPDRYNVVGRARISNLKMAQMVAELLGKPLRYVLEDFHSTRPGHDPHYGLDGSKLSELGWEPPVEFGAALARTVRWSTEHPEWLFPDCGEAAQRLSRGVLVAG